MNAQIQENDRDVKILKTTAWFGTVIRVMHEAPVEWPSTVHLGLHGPYRNQWLLTEIHKPSASVHRHIVVDIIVHLLWMYF